MARLMITPGVNKFRTGYETPFDHHREQANRHIDKARSILIVGYGFNDDHLETHLRERINKGTKTLILSRTLSGNARSLIEENSNAIGLENYECDTEEGTRALWLGEETKFPSVKLWDVGELAKGALG